MIPLITTLLPILGNVIDKIIPNTAEREKAKAELALKLAENETELLKLFTQIDQGQIDINKEEAKSSSLFVAGARPFIMWVCASAFAWTYVLQPFLVFISFAVNHPVTNLPSLSMGEIMPVLLGVLGLGSLRTYEKIKNAQGNH